MSLQPCEPGWSRSHKGTWRAGRGQQTRELESPPRRMGHSQRQGLLGEIGLWGFMECVSIPTSYFDSIPASVPMGRGRSRQRVGLARCP